MDNTMRVVKQAYQDVVAKRAEYHKKRRQAFVKFIKPILEQDKRYSIVPYKDSRSKMCWSRDEQENSILGDVMLKRDGDYAPVLIHPNEPQYGVMISAGSTHTACTIQAYPSPSLAWSVLNIANELERQFVREVEWEMNKKGMKVIKHANNNNSTRYPNNRYRTHTRKSRSIPKAQ
jgi:hypothetical protein